MDTMDKLEGIQKHLREEIERTQRELEENVKCKCYSNAARLEQKNRNFELVLEFNCSI